MSIRQEYRQHGVDGYYATQSDAYANPHAVDVVLAVEHAYRDEWKTILDLACGDGLVTKVLADRASAIGCDPYMADRYRQETGNRCLELSFADIAQGASLPRVDAIFCSYGIDLVDQSRLALVLWGLSQASKWLVTIRPNRHIVESPHWEKVEQARFGKAAVTVYRSV